MKIDNARSRLVAIIDAQERRPLAYGTDDCIMRVCDSVLAILPDGRKRQTIEALRARFVGQYDTLDGGYALLRAAGYRSPLALFGSLFARIHISECEDGDIGARKIGKHWGFGVIIGAHFYVTADGGTGILARSDAQKAFRVE